MKLKLLAIALLFVPISQAMAADKAELKTEEEKIGYSMGLELGRTYKKANLPINFEMFIRGIEDSFKGNKFLIENKEARVILNRFKQKIIVKQQMEYTKKGQENKKTGEEFLAKNKQKKGVVTLPSGLQYQILKEGKGKKPTLSDNVTVNYKGSLVDGTVFDSSEKYGQPATFQVNQVIQGWQDAIQLMSPGSKWRIFVPTELAYGQNAPEPIGPNSALIFDVELIKIN